MVFITSKRVSRSAISYQPIPLRALGKRKHARFVFADFALEAEVEHACLVKRTEKGDVIALPNVMPSSSPSVRKMWR